MPMLSSHQRRFGFVALLAWLIPFITAVGQEAAAPFHRVSELYHANPSQVALGLPVILEGQVSALLPDGKGFYLMEGDRGIKVLTREACSERVPGARVRVQGRSAMGSALPWIREAVVDDLGPGHLPRPLPLRLLPADPTAFFDDEPRRVARILGLEEGRWVSLDGEIRELRQEGTRLHFVVAMDNYSLRGSIGNGMSQDVPKAWLGGRVHLEAVSCAGETRMGTIRDFNLLVPDPSHFICMTSGIEEPFRIPLTSIRDFQLNENSFPESRMVHVRGAVTRQRIGVSIFIQDENGSLFVRTNHNEPLELGDRVDVVGFPSYDRSRPCLSFGIVRKMASGPPVVPVALMAEEAGESNLDGALIELEGRLLEVVHEPPFKILVMTRGTRVFDAVLEQEKWDPSFDHLKIGSLLKVAGICIQKPRGRLSPAFFQIALRSKLDVRLMEAPPWWTRRYAVNLIHILILLAVLALAWGWSLRRRVASQTRRIRQENEARRHLENELQQAQKMESVGMLAGGVAHDFNNLLTVIQNYVSLALDVSDLDPKVGKALQSIQGASQRAANLTRQLLTFGRRQVMKMQPVPLNDVVSHFSGMLRRIIGENIDLKCELSAGLPVLHADLGMIEQVLMNLVVNARDAMPEGGRITLRTFVAPPSDSVLNSHEQVCLEVCDTGVGIPEEILPHIFEPFYTTKEKHRGTGLGLATVHAIIQQHQGHITVESQLGKGSCFRVFLPGHGHSFAPGPESPSPKDALRSGHERILLVEDDPDLLQVTQQSLESMGYVVTTASSGDAALERWNACEGAFDLLLTDLVMPGNLSGIQLAEELLTRKPDLKLILSTGYSEELLSAQGQELLRRVGFLPKPYSVKELSERVREQLDLKNGD